MVNRNLLRQYEPSDDQLQEELDAAFDQNAIDWLPAEEQEFRDNKLVTGRVRKVTADHVWVDVGYKSEGVIALREWYDEGAGQDRAAPSPATRSRCCWRPSRTRPAPSSSATARPSGRRNGKRSSPSTRKATSSPAWSPARSRAACWSTSASTSSCRPARSTSAGRRTSPMYIGQTIECKILNIDEARRNIVVSRRKLLEDQREEMKKKLLAEIEPGQIRKGVVKNIAEFGAFVDLGGIDGLLHITDMAWDRVTNPQRGGAHRPGAGGRTSSRSTRRRRRSPWASSRRRPARGPTWPTSTPSAAGTPARSSTS